MQEFHTENAHIGNDRQWFIQITSGENPIHDRDAEANKKLNNCALGHKSNNVQLAAKPAVS